jgi:UDP-glucose 4-epimerase
MARCLITGHRGFIGTQLYNKLKELGHEVLGMDFTPDEQGDSENILECLYEKSLHENSDWMKFKPEYVFHLACIPRVAYSVENPVETMRNNVLCATYVLNYARKVGAKRVIYSGSSSVVGNGNGPTSPYGLQKLISEMECKLYSDLYGLDTVSLRYFNVYSEDQKASGPYATAVSNWMEYIRQDKKPFITGDGEQRRDMLYVQDAVAANIFAMEYEGRFAGQHYDVGTGSNISLNEVKDIVNSYFPEVAFEYVEERKGDVLYTQAVVSPLKALGWKTEISIAQGINSCFKKLKGEQNV